MLICGMKKKLSPKVPPPFVRRRLFSADAEAADNCSSLVFFKLFFLPGEQLRLLSDGSCVEALIRERVICTAQEIYSRQDVTQQLFHPSHPGQRKYPSFESNNFPHFFLHRVSLSSSDLAPSTS